VKRPILWYIIVLGSLGYGLMALTSALQAWRTWPTTVHVLEQRLALVLPADAEARVLSAHVGYLRSPWYVAQVTLALAAGGSFLLGTYGFWRRQAWSRTALLVGAWCALSHMAWVLIASLEVFRSTGAGMAYQFGLLNLLWVLLIVAVVPLERVRTLVEGA